MASLSREFRQEALTIAESASVSSDWVINDMAFGSLLMPAVLTGAVLAIEGIVKKGATFMPIRDSDGTVLTITHVADVNIRVPDAAFAFWAIRFVSDGTEAAARTLEVLAKG